MELSERFQKFLTRVWVVWISSALLFKIFTHYFVISTSRDNNSSSVLCFSQPVQAIILVYFQLLIWIFFSNHLGTSILQGSSKNCLCPFSWRIKWNLIYFYILMNIQGFFVILVNNLVESRQKRPQSLQNNSISISMNIIETIDNKS